MLSQKSSPFSPTYSSTAFSPSVISSQAFAAGLGGGAAAAALASSSRFLACFRDMDRYRIFSVPGGVRGGAAGFPSETPLPLPAPPPPPSSSRGPSPAVALTGRRRRATVRGGGGGARALRERLLPCGGEKREEDSGGSGGENILASISSLPSLCRWLESSSYPSPHPHENDIFAPRHVSKYQILKKNSEFIVTNKSGNFPPMAA